MTPLEHVRLADHCTRGVGGPARYFVEAHDESAVLAAFEWARARRVPLHVLGGGSNLVVADEGVDGLVVKIALRGVDTREADGAVELTAAAGEPWDELVRRSVDRGWAGLECLSGIPGLVGATPMQNVGAYGQEVSDTVSVVRALDPSTGRIVAFGNRECRFTYRDSLFRSGGPDRYVGRAASDIRGRSARAGGHGRGRHRGRPAQVPFRTAPRLCRARDQYRRALEHVEQVAGA